MPQSIDLVCLKRCDILCAFALDRQMVVPEQIEETIGSLPWRWQMGATVHLMTQHTCYLMLLEASRTETAGHAQLAYWLSLASNQPSPKQQWLSQVKVSRLWLLLEGASATLSQKHMSYSRAPCKCRIQNVKPCYCMSCCAAQSGCCTVFLYIKHF